VSIEPAQPPASNFALRAAVAVLIAVVILVVVAVLWLSIRVLLDAFAGVLFALFLTTLSGWVSRATRLRHGYSLALVFIALSLLAGGVGWFVENRLSAQTRELAQSLPQSLDQLRALIDASPVGRFLLEHAATVSSGTGSEAWQRVSSFIGTVADFLIALAVIFFVGLFGAATPEVYRTGLLMLVPPVHRERAAEVLDAIAFNLRWWLAGQVVLMMLVGVGVGLGIWLLGVKLALALGLIAGILEIIPYVGAWLAAVPAALVALLVGPWHAAMVLGMFLVVHLFEGYIVGPLVQRRAVHLPPALTVLAQLLLGSLLGLPGIFVAAPLTVTIIIAVKMLYVQDTLGDRAIAVPGERVTPPPGIPPCQ
jgi:predicted PurR-regulated permease PerM